MPLRDPQFIRPRYTFSYVPKLRVCRMLANKYLYIILILRRLFYMEDADYGDNEGVMEVMTWEIILRR